MSQADQSTRRRRLAGIALVAALAGVLVAVVVVRDGGEKVVNANSDTLVLVDQKTDGGLDALGSGRLADVGGCLGWAPSDGSTVGTVVIWPHGTNIETPDPLRVRIDGTVYELGDTVQIAGGNVGPLKTTSYFYDQVPEACRAADVWLANNG